MTRQVAVGMEGLELMVRSDGRQLGTRVFEALLGMAKRAVEQLETIDRAAPQGRPSALLSKLRGTGRGISSSALFAELERAHPLDLQSPFEGSERVSGGVWIAADILDTPISASVAKLRWESRATDLPLHVHEYSDRFIIVQKGRGFFHVTDEDVASFTGTRVRSIPARELDVFLFRRGVVHTFSTDTEPMILLSCQLPFLPFDDPRQYRLPKIRWTAAEYREDAPPRIACDPAWTMLAGL